MKNLIKNIIILAATLVLAQYFSWYTGNWYEKFIHSPGTWIDLRALVGLPLSYIFFTTLLFTAFGGTKKYWWMGILLIPAAVFEVYFDLEHIYFPILLGAAGWLLGYLVSKIIPTSK